MPIKSHAFCFLLLCFCSEHLVEAAEPYFPKGIFFQKDVELSDLVADHLGERLKALQEPSLAKFSRENQSAESYRLFWWASGKESISFRLTTIGDQAVLVIRQNGAEIPNKPKQPDTRRTINLTTKQWDEAMALLNKTTFWSAPASIKESWGIADGDVILIEAARKGKYHLVDRAGSTTSESYKSFCRHIMELSGSPMLDVWDKWREAERSRPEYKREYKETEDTGEIEKEKDEPS